MKKLLLVLCCVALSGVVHADLLVNGNFSDPGAGSAGQISAVTITGWTSWGTDGWYANDIDSQMSVKFWATGAGIYQNFDATPGYTYTVGAQAYQTTAEQLSGDRGAYVKVEWFDSGMNAVGTPTTVGTMTAANPDDAWVTLSGDVTAPANAAYGRTVLGLTETSGGGGAAYFDNATVTIPEPAALSMIGMGFFALIRIRKMMRRA